MDRYKDKGNVTSAKLSAPIWAGLTEKQERFAHLVSDGLNFSAAYREVYDASEMSKPSVWREAHRLSRNDKVAMRIAELVAARQDEERLQAHMRSYRVTAHLEKMMTSGASETTRLRAAELLGKTVGLFAEKARNSDHEWLLRPRADGCPKWGYVRVADLSVIKALVLKERERPNPAIR